MTKIPLDVIYMSKTPSVKMKRNMASILLSRHATAGSAKAEAQKNLNKIGVLYVTHTPRVFQPKGLKRIGQKRTFQELYMNQRLGL